MAVPLLSKPSGLCLAATGADGKLIGYLILSRYDTVWHLMNVAIDPSLWYDDRVLLKKAREYFSKPGLANRTQLATWAKNRTQ